MKTKDRSREVEKPNPRADSGGGPERRTNSSTLDSRLLDSQNRGFPPTGVYSGTWLASPSPRLPSSPHSILETLDLFGQIEAHSWPHCCSI
jgi:hypothetical protein